MINKILDDKLFKLRRSQQTEIVVQIGEMNVRS